MSVRPQDLGLRLEPCPALQSRKTYQNPSTQLTVIRPTSKVEMSVVGCDLGVLETQHLVAISGLERAATCPRQSKPRFTGAPGAHSDRPGCTLERPGRPRPTDVNGQTLRARYGCLPDSTRNSRISSALGWAAISGV